MSKVWVNIEKEAGARLEPLEPTKSLIYQLFTKKILQDKRNLKIVWNFWQANISREKKNLMRRLEWNLWIPSSYVA